MTPEKNTSSAVLIRPRVYLGDGIAIGPGKIDLLRAVGKTRSIAAAARSLGMPYKRAWLLTDSLNRRFSQLLVATMAGGKGGGGAYLTTLGEELVALYDALEERLNAEAAPELEALRKLAGGPGI
ncbi:LysR family transcriptional regulator [Marinobacter sp.]|uniref:winged helix-turn-helix domain-containing protein n=1 Tax=Marinobacter sp. TaxID=50741 RepID=UPI002B46CC12|nr:LysR family transcriptional regulator [Marinobacter sp.]HKK57762.1 LysR family transcriptional regulator [Marinobacter sp.]